MRGRRRGRNRSSVQDEQNSAPQTDAAPGGGSVKLVETSTDLEPEAPVEARPTSGSAAGTGDDPGDHTDEGDQL